MPQLQGSIKRHRLMAAVAAAGLAAGTSLAAGAVTSATAAASASAHAASAHAASAPTASAPKAKFPVTSFEIDSHLTKVHSSTHKLLTFFVFISNGSSGLPDIASQTAGITVGLSPQRGSGVVLAARPRQDATLSAARSKGTQESHEWGFGLKPSSLHINTKKGTGTVKTKKLLKSYGKFTLKLSPAGKAHKSCSASTGFTSTRKVRLVGSSRFNTKSGKHGWGVVGARKTTLKATLTVDYGTPECGQPTMNQCPSVGIFVDTFSNHTDVGASSAPGQKSRVTAFRQVNLSSPKGAVRSDLLAGTAKPLKAKHDADGNLTFLISPRSSNASGSATVTAPPPPGTTTCKKTTTDFYFGATWTNGAKKFAMRGQIEKRITIKNNPNADAEVTTSTA
jgi:hypothetical protein